MSLQMHAKSAASEERLASRIKQSSQSKTPSFTRTTFHQLTRALIDALHGGQILRQAPGQTGVAY